MAEDKKLRQIPTRDSVAVPQCPIGEKQCGVVDEVTSLRLELTRLGEQLRTDPLTRLFNYRHLLHALAQEMERTRRTGQATALVMVDLDYFKQVNDRWGHEVGNLALKTTADVLRQITRRLDIPCRYGGEEFAVILPSTDRLTAIQVAERIREAIALQPVRAGNADIDITASLGVDIYHAHQQQTPEQLIARADAALYQAKQQGRNRVCHGIAEERAVSAVSSEERDLLVALFSNDSAKE